MRPRSTPFAPSSAVVSSKSRNRLLSALTVTLCLAGAERSMAQVSWDGGGSTDNFGDGANWVGDAVPGNNLTERIFIGNTRNAPVNNLSNTPTQRAIGIMRFSNNGESGKTNAFTVSGNLLNLSGNIITVNVTTGGPITDEISLDLNLTGGSRTFNIGTNHNMLISGDIGENGGVYGFTKSSAGTLTLSGANTFTGSVTIQQGIVNVDTIADSGSSNLGLGTSMVIGNAGTTGTLNYTGVGNTTARTVRIGTNGTNSNGGATISANGANGGTGLQFAAAVNPSTSVFNTTETTTIARTLTLSGSNTDANQIAGVIQNNNGANIAVTKSGEGRWILGGTNTYDGATTISAGTLVINGDQSGAVGAVSVAAGATLGGNGTVGGATTFTGNSTHAVGSASATVGTQTFSSTLAYGTGTIFEWNLAAASATDPGVVSDALTGTYDKVVATGAVTGGNAKFKVVLGGNTFDDVFWNTDKSWTDVFTGAGAPALLGSIFTDFDASGGITSNGTVAGRGQFTFNGSTATLNWTAVPEPSSALAGLLITAGLLRRRRGL